MGLESDLSRQVMESTGWLAAHRRNQASTKQNPVDRHSNSLAGRVSPGEPAPSVPGEWRSWSMRLFSSMATVGEEAELNDA